MKRIYQILGVIALGLTIVPPILFMSGSIGDNAMKTAMLVGAVLWFTTTPKWMKAVDN